MCSGTGLHRHRAARLCSEERKQLLTREAATEECRARRIRAMRMENLLCDIQTDRANLSHGRLLSDGRLTPPSWHIDAVGGVHPITRCGPWLFFPDEVA
jgi:hypothetical protein